jgi:hypothetical protein
VLGADQWRAEIFSRSGPVSGSSRGNEALRKASVGACEINVSLDGKGFVPRASLARAGQKVREFAG